MRYDIMQQMHKINIILALGKIAFDACINFYKQEYIIRNKKIKNIILQKLFNIF